MKKDKNGTHEPSSVVPGALTNQESGVSWATLSWFQITYNQRTQDNSTAHVYRNGRQQVPITVIIEARNANNEIVTLENGELERISFCHYQTGIELSTLSQTRHPEYDYYPESTLYTSEPDRTDSSSQPIDEVKSKENTVQRQQIIRWYTTTSPDTVRIAASITSPNGDTFHTHSPEVDSGGKPTGGKFNSSLTVQPQTPIVFGASAFNAFRRDANGNDHFDVDLYDIYFINPQYKIRNSVHYTVQADKWHYSWNKSDSNKVQTAYKADRCRIVTFKTFVPTNNYSITFYVNEFFGK
ncbi:MULTISPECIES: hypothetical protein [unclassified Pseudomonas]|uniref:hypothetical protein n=1 Tax=unclassified Pseudomonas TaxID=196821 RepID=UPI002AC94B63|nr:MULTISPECIES: hypothetical protein [unclassified Pseudomonas]MEB0042288.1 hypothetical protein [Pseudomonas sp. MH10]MEB0122645.1 hypothetical protein [Pseudomonas sp. CCI1.2]WPX65524.1 hypothetical protein RHM59_07740 [Pseudomonas sp. MH10]